jgi:phospholipase C
LTRTSRSLTKEAAYAEQYFTPKGLHPSEPNYIWFEAGDNIGITTDDDPAKNHKATKDHLSSQLEAAGVSWKAYAEDISGTDCPLKSNGLYGAKHTPQLFFDDVTDGNSATSKHCIEHVRPYSELATDLSKNTVARYNFITPNLCNDMHGELGLTCPFGGDLIKRGDDWLSKAVPAITGSAAYRDGGLLIVMWDEGDEALLREASDGPLPFFVLSANAKKGVAVQTKFTHSATLRSIETIFGVPLLRGAQTSNDLSDMFTTFP